jgi:hypothetical protein
MTPCGWGTSCGELATVVHAHLVDVSMPMDEYLRQFGRPLCKQHARLDVRMYEESLDGSMYGLLIGPLSVLAVTA